MNRAVLTLTLTLALGARAYSLQEGTTSSPEKEVPRYSEVTPRIGTAGQPTEAGFRTVAAKGYQAVINLRTAGESVDLEAEEKLVRSLGMQYYSIPVVGTDPKEEQATAFLKLMDDLRDEKVLVHCAAANRVGGFLMIYRVIEDGLNVEQAEEEARKVGLRSESLVKFAREMIAKQKAKAGSRP